MSAVIREEPSACAKIIASLIAFSRALPSNAACVRSFPFIRRVLNASKSQKYSKASLSASNQIVLPFFLSSYVSFNKFSHLLIASSSSGIISFDLGNNLRRALAVDESSKKAAAYKTAFILCDYGIYYIVLNHPKQ